MGCNSAFSKLLGVSEKDIVGKTDFSLFPDKIAGLLSEEDLKMMGRKCAIRSEEWVKYPSGKDVFLDILKTPYYSQEGEVLGVLGVCRDITEIRAAQNKVEQSEQMLQRVINSIPAVIYLKDKDGRHMMVNDYYEVATGISAEEVLGRLDADVFPDAVAKGFVLEDQWVIRNRKELQTEDFAPDLYGVRHDFLTVKVPMLNEADEVVGIVGVSLDISRQKKLEKQLISAKEEAELAAQVKSEFLANMSHEIRTPMNAIIGLVRQLKRIEMPDKQLGYLNKMDYAAASLLNVINDVLDFSKIESGELLLNESKFNLYEMIKVVVGITVIQAHQKNIEYIVDQPVGLSYFLIGDAERLQQVLVNLLSNATKFTNTGRIVLKIEQLVQNGVDQIRFSVEDTGIGIDQDKLDNIFNSFTQADTTISREYGGTGLGLAISKRLVDMMGGELQVKSQIAVGSCFSFTLKFCQSRKIELVPRLSEYIGVKKIIVLDTNKVSERLLEKILLSFGLDVIACCSEEQFLKVLEEVCIASRGGDGCELALIDWTYSNQGFFDGIRNICQENGCLTPKIIVMMSSSDGVNNNLAHEVGGNTLLCKPIFTSDLLSVLADLYPELTQFRTGKDDARDWWSDGCFSDKHVLLVEDNEINQLVARELLAESGIRVTGVANGKECIDLLDLEKFDLILMDIQMPIMDGYTATKLIRKQEVFKNLPIVAMTAHSLKEDRERCLNLGMNEYISKPINPVNLYNVLSKEFGLGDKEDHRSRSGSFNLPGAYLAASLEEVPGILPCLDIKKSLVNLGSNFSLYLQLCERFRDDTGDIHDAILSSFELGNSEQLGYTAHSLISTAATVGAFELSDLAAGFERSLNNNLWPDDMEIKNIIQVLNTVVESIDFLLEGQFKQVDGLEEVASGSVLESMQLLFDDLKSALEQSDLIDQEIIQQLIAFQKKCRCQEGAESLLAEEVEIIIDEIDTFDYQQAMQRLEHIVLMFSKSSMSR